MAVIGTRGQHVIAEYWGCAYEPLNNAELIQKYMVTAAQEAGATVIGTSFHSFNPTGVSGVVVVSESHFSIHTWPEEGYAACDFFTCGKCDPQKAIQILGEFLESTSPQCLKIDRGVRGTLKVESI